MEKLAGKTYTHEAMQRVIVSPSQPAMQPASQLSFSEPASQIAMIVKNFKSPDAGDDPPVPTITPGEGV